MPDRHGLLLETVAAGVRTVLTAASAVAVLPDVLGTLARVVKFDRATIVESATGTGGVPLPTVLLDWASPGNAVPPVSTQALRQISEVGEYAAWYRPLSEGRHVVTLRDHAPRSVQDFLAQLHTIASLTVPVFVEGLHWGHVSFDDCQGERDWRGDDIKALGALAEVIGAAITRERFLGLARQRGQLLQAMTDSAAEIMTAADLQQSIARALGTVARATGVDRVLVMEVTRERGQPRRLLRNFWHGPRAGLFLSRIVQTIASPPAPDVVQWMQPLEQGDAVQAHCSSAAPGVREQLERFQASSTLIVPIMVDGHYWGHIGLDVCGSAERAWSETEVDLLKTLAKLIGTAITRERHLAALATADTIIQNSPTILYRLGADPALPLHYVSENVSALGYAAARLIADPLRYREIVHPEDRQMVQAGLQALLQPDAEPSTLEFRVLTSGGEVRWVECRHAPVSGDGVRAAEIEGILADITERKAAESKIAQLARSDALTGLANRMTFADRLRQAFAAARRGAHAFAVQYLDLDRFKEVNDTLGHHAGDQLLQQVAHRLERATREIDMVARLGGDEFAIVQAEVLDPEAAGRLAGKLIDVISAPYSVEGNDVRIGASVGIALYDADAASPDALLAQADQALYRAKHAGRGQFRFHSEEIDHETRVHLALADDLRLALARGELAVLYQPQVELATARIVGMEALLRWNHPTRGLLLPEDFLPVAEKYGLVQQLGRWTLDVACRQMSLWRRAGLTVPVIAVNVALAQIRMGQEFVRDVTDCIRRWELQPSDLELDVTEQVLARSVLAQSRVLEELRDLGVGIAIDDFGAQYSSLDYLRAYRVNRLKIARMMIAAAAAEPGGRSMVRAILSLARELGVRVVAEGVETEQQRSMLVEAGAHTQGQGFYYSRAVPAEETLELLRSGVMLPGQRRSS